MERPRPIETEHNSQYNDDFAYSSLPFPDGLEGVRVAAGAFTMGSTASEVDFLLHYYEGTDHKNVPASVQYYFFHDQFSRPTQVPSPLPE